MTGLKVGALSAVAALAVSGVAVAATLGSEGNGGPAHPRTTPLAARSKPTAAPSSPSPVNHQPVSVTAVTPKTALTATATITITFAGPAPAKAPVLNPAQPGSWSQPTTDSWEFTPAQPWSPDAPVTARLSGVIGTASLSWHGPTPSVLRLQQLLAQAGYLPLQFTPAGPAPADRAAALRAAYSPPAGQFSWRWANVPAQLRQDWKPGSSGAMTRGAVMAFERANQLAVDGIAGSAVWSALLAHPAGPPAAPHPYAVAVADLNLPQRLSLWVAGKTVLTSPVNSGIPGARTPDGFFPVFERATSVTMKGTMPDGQHYDDPGVPWDNFFYLGDAIHGFPRASYGYPQSNGCLELPIPTAKEVYPHLYIGALVVVTGKPA